jgi:OOP family OmpA-OmpF porin
MKHVQVGRVLAAALLVSATALAAGCQASLNAQAGGGSPSAAPPPPPPPAATPAPTPAPTPPPAQPTGQSKIQGETKGSRVMIPGAIVFDSGKASIKVAESKATLDQLKEFLDKNPQVTLLRIEGHTDSDGDDNMNLKLSGERALAVVTYLVSQGISRDRLLAVGFGETKPVAPNDTKENKEQNRRTEFHMAQIEGKNYAGRAPDGGGTVFKLALPSPGPPRALAERPSLFVPLPWCRSPAMVRGHASLLEAPAARAPGPRWLRPETHPRVDPRRPRRSHRQPSPSR